VVISTISCRSLIWTLELGSLYFRDSFCEENLCPERLKTVTPPLVYQESVSRVSPQLLISFDRNRYSVNAMAVGKTVSVRAYANRIIMVMNGTVVGTHQRHLARDKLIYDPWHYLAVLEKKTGALRNGAPFKQWDLPESMSAVRKILEDRLGGDRQFVSILSVVSRYGLELVAAACAQYWWVRMCHGCILLIEFMGLVGECSGPHEDYR